MLTDDDILREFREAGALLDGHFILSSGLHSSAYLQCARVMMDAARAERLCGALATKLEKARLIDGIELIISPAMGGVVVGYEMGRQLKRPSMFFERVDGTFELRRGFEIKPGQTCLVVEDVVTTGLSSLECIAAAERLGGDVKAATALVDRSGGRADLRIPFIPLITLDIPLFTLDQLPATLKRIPAIKPGSRWLERAK